MNNTELFDVFESIFDTSRCMEYLSKIYENDKYFTFSAFEKTAYNCVEFMRKAGLYDIDILPVKADGKTVYGDWVIPQAWEAEYAVLKSEDDDFVFADYQKTPCSLVMYSAPTPQGGITAEVVIVDDVPNADINVLRGNFIVTSRPAGELVHIAKKAGSISIISDFMPLFKGVRDNIDDVRNVVRWDNDFCTPINDTGLFAFNLSPENGRILRNHIQKNKTFRLTAEIRTRLYDGECYTVSGKIRGETEDSICIYGHLYEPGAHDNASGCAVILELAACINNAIKNGLLPKPKRTLNFVVGYECVGSMAWITAEDRKAVCGFVADMVGTDVIDNTHMCIWSSPLSNLSFADAHIIGLIKSYKEHKADGFIWESKKFSIGTDNILSDPFFKMSSPAMICEPALSYHSSLDTPNRIERDVIFRNGVIIGTYLFSLAAADTEDAKKLWKMTVGYIDDNLPNGISEITDILKQEILNTARQSMINFCHEYASDIPFVSKSQILVDIPDYAKGKAYLVPYRTVAGCLTFKANPGLSEIWNPAWNNRLNLPLFWADGKRTLWEITVLSAAEVGEYSDREIKVRWEWLSEYFKFLTDKGYLAFRT